MQDSKFLHFLKDFPSQYILTFLILVVLAVYVQYQIQFLERILDLVIGGLLTTLIGSRKPTTNVTADTVNTPNMRVDNMPDAIVNNDGSGKPDDEE